MEVIELHDAFWNLEGARPPKNGVNLVFDMVEELHRMLNESVASYEDQMRMLIDRLCLYWGEWFAHLLELPRPEGESAEVSETAPAAILIQASAGWMRSVFPPVDVTAVFCGGGLVREMVKTMESPEWVMNIKNDMLFTLVAGVHLFRIWIGGVCKDVLVLRACASRLAAIFGVAAMHRHWLMVHEAGVTTIEIHGHALSTKKLAEEYGVYATSPFHGALGTKYCWHRGGHAVNTAFGWAIFRSVDENLGLFLLCMCRVGVHVTHELLCEVCEEHIVVMAEFNAYLNTPVYDY